MKSNSYLYKICVSALLSSMVIVPFVQASQQQSADIIPFREIGESLGLRAKNYSNFFSSGVTIFDANNDGLMDIYFPHDGRSPFKATTKKAVLSSEQVPAIPSTLYINQGNDHEGNPVLKPMQDLMKNNQHVKAELLIENKYIPREKITDDELSIGRISKGVVAADFNADGLTDLYVLSGLYGTSHQTKETAMPFYPVERNLGRNGKRIKPFFFTTPPIIGTDMKDGLVTKVNFGKQQEWEGTNRLFLNRGDKDGDGIPEWEDVTEKANVGGKWDSQSATVADIDRDGDLDIYVANFHDYDFFGFGMLSFAGNRNQLYVNQLVETGELTFIDKAVDMSVSGLHVEENLPHGSYSGVKDEVFSTSKQVVNGKQVGEEADHSWSAQLADWNDDGWPDLAVANDIGGPRLRLYENAKGQSFKRLKKFDQPKWEGCWMGIESGDLDGDGNQELLATNCGSDVLSLRNTALTINTEEELFTLTLAQINYPKGKSTLHNILLSYTPQSGIKNVTLDTEIEHSTVVPPNMLNENNISPKLKDFYHQMKFQSSLSGLEFSFGPIFFDVENDGDLDVYLAGALARGNDGFFGDFTGGPGRLLINHSTPGQFSFSDKVFEYRVMDIDHMDYDHQPPRRVAPGTGWHKRDHIYMDDLDSYSELGLDASKAGKIRDIIRMHEAASGMISGDLNGDGFADLVVTHAGGYNSLSPSARNLKVNINGQARALPGTDKLRHPPTNYEPGATFLYINGGVTDSANANWVKLRLTDRSSKNTHAVGSKVTINKNIVRQINIGGPTYSSYAGDLLVGLGQQKLHQLKVRWPSGSTETTTYPITKPLSNQLVCVDRELGVIDCQ